MPTQWHPLLIGSKSSPLLSTSMAVCKKSPLGPFHNRAELCLLVKIKNWLREGKIMAREGWSVYREESHFTETKAQIRISKPLD